jgi:hypothetical protein
MLYRPYRPRKIEIDPDSVSAKSPQVSERLDRIASNFRLLSEMLTEVELKILPQEESAAAAPAKAETRPKPR